MRVGIDLIEIERFERMAKDDIKLGTLFTQKERDYFSKMAFPLLHIAGTFAAKEAVAKAFKTGFNGRIVPLDIEVVRIDNVPQINLLGGAKKFFQDNGFKEIEISITHNKSDAVAICIIN